LMRRAHNDHEPVAGAMQHGARLRRRRQASSYTA
jgi:hypothetical protein